MGIGSVGSARAAKRARGSIAIAAAVVAAGCGGAPSAENTRAMSQALTDLTIGFVSAPKEVAPGASAEWVVGVSNLGQDAAQDATVTITFGPGTLAKSASGPGWRCVPNLNIARCTTSGVAAGPGQQLLTFDAIATTVQGTLPVTATISTTSADGAPANDTTTALTSVIAHADLTVTQVEIAPLVVQASSTVTAVVSVDNAGPDTALGLKLRVTLPGNVTSAAAAGVDWVSDLCVPTSPGVVELCLSRDELGAGQSTSIAVTALAPPTGGPQEIRARVSAESAESTHDDNGASATFNVIASPSSTQTPGVTGGVQGGGCNCTSAARDTRDARGILLALPVAAWIARRRRARRYW